MAVGRVKLDTRQYNLFVKRLKPLRATNVTAKRAGNELFRATGKGKDARRSGIAELTRTEVEMLLTMCDGMPSARVKLEECLAEIAVSEQREAESKRALTALMDRSRGATGSAL